MKKKYLRPELYAIEEDGCELLAHSLENVSSNLEDDESVEVSEEAVEEGFWGR